MICDPVSQKKKDTGPQLGYEAELVSWQLAWHMTESYSYIRCHDLPRRFKFAKLLGTLLFSIELVGEALIIC